MTSRIVQIIRQYNHKYLSTNSINSYIKIYSYIKIKFKIPSCYNKSYFPQIHLDKLASPDAFSTLSSKLGKSEKYDDTQK